MRRLVLIGIPALALAACNQAVHRDLAANMADVTNQTAFANQSFVNMMLAQNGMSPAAPDAGSDAHNRHTIANKM